ncbi:hemicentin-1-like isoform X2 [Rhopalosiphum maidis]|uniref:hemicentin-1-like isoform X2 n=1 Tax=Rhopalosiphum maidis TaxID=43146 RepID=UPI000EFEC410|nr:hemicentin-1-like isoform X2 [Rhopalosiphum maidis]
MINYHRPFRILPMEVLIIFISILQLCQQVHSKDVILQNEENVIIIIGNDPGDDKNLNVKCDYSGTFMINSFQWKRVKSNKWHSPNEMLRESQWLCFQNARDEDEGQYICTINGFNGSGTFYEKRSFILNFSGAYDVTKDVPTFQEIDIAENVPLLINSTLHLNCPFMSTSDTVYSWYKNDKLLVERKAIVDGFHRFDNDYNSKSVRLSDAGNYKCVVKNTMGSIQFKFNVVVYDDEKKMPLSFAYPRDLSLKSGDSARFYCQAIACNCLRPLNWYYLNNTNPMDIDIQTVDLSQFKKMKHVGLNNFKLILENVTVRDSGWYICVRAGSNKMLMAEAKLDVDKRLEMCPPLKSDSLDISCSLNGKYADCSDQSIPNTIARPSCKAKYIVENEEESIMSPEITCQSNGVWNYKLFKCIPNCGIAYIKNQPTINEGDKALVGTAPWNVGIYQLNSQGNYDMICGGSIITLNLVITAAHCFWVKGISKIISVTGGQYKIAVGKYKRNYTVNDNDFTQIMNVTRIYLHEGFNGPTGFYTGDIAIVVMSNKVSINNGVSPICIDWKNHFNVLNGTQGKVGLKLLVGE